MNVVIFGKGLGKPRHISLTGRAAAAITFLFGGALVAAAFIGGYWYSTFNGSGLSLDDARTMSAQLDAERVAIETIRQEAEDKLDALAIRIGQMNARVIRLDALGRRLTEMADIDTEEFDFDAAPAIGGPGTPARPAAAGPRWRRAAGAGAGAAGSGGCAVVSGRLGRSSADTGGSGRARGAVVRPRCAPHSVARTARGGDDGTGVAAEVEGFVHVHRNVLGDADATGGVSDIDSTVHRWLNPVARVTITLVSE